MITIRNHHYPERFLHTFGALLLWFMEQIIAILARKEECPFLRFVDQLVEYTNWLGGVVVEVLDQ